MYSPAAVQIWTEWAVDRIRVALREHEQGNFRLSAALADHIRRDDRVFATLENMIFGALGLNHRTEPNPAAKNQELAKELAKQVDAWWFTCIPEATIAEALRWLLLMGFAIGELVQESVAGEWRPKMKIHHLQHARWCEAEQCFYLAVAGGKGTGDDEAREVKVTPGDGRWVLLTLGGGRPWMNGAIRALAIPFVIRTYAKRDWARRTEVQGQGVRVAKVPLDYDTDRVRRFLRQISKLGDETSVVVPAGYDFEIQSIDSGSADVFAKLIAMCDTAITLVLLGQNLTTQIEGGSYGAAQTHHRVLLDRIKALVEALATVCHDQIVVPWVRFNVAEAANDNEEIAADVAPWPRYDPTPPEDLQAKAQALLTLAQALTALRGMGVNIAPILDQYELTLVEGTSTKEPQIFAYHLPFLKLNEVRAAVGKPPVDGGEELIINLQPKSAATGDEKKAA